MSRISTFFVSGHTTSACGSGIRFVLLLGALLWGGCSGTAEDHAQGLVSGSLGDPVVHERGCETGATRPCGRTLTQASGIISCFKGTAYCDDGSWSECNDGETSFESDPRTASYRSLSGPRLAALSPTAVLPQTCDDNPCDPQCQAFNEDPDDITGSSNGTPGGLPAFPGGPPITACEHDLCSSGTALGDHCHPCVESVCAANPSCCTTAWTSTCADAAYSLCAGARPPLSLCELGLYSDLTLTLANRSSSDAVVAAYGDVNLATEAYPLGVFSKGNISFSSLNQPISVPRGIVADGWVDAQNADYAVQGFIEAGGDVTIRAWDVSGNVSSGGALAGQNSTTIGGDARANSSISSVTSIAGTTCSGPGCYTHLPVVLPAKTMGTAIPILPVNCSGATNFSANGTTVNVPSPGTYGNVSAINGGAIRLQGEGVYYFKSFSINNRVILQRTATNTGAGWDIRVCNTVLFDNGTQFRGATVGGVTPALVLDSTNSVLMDPSLVRFYADTSSAINMGTDVYFTGIFMAPKASVTKANVNTPPTRAQVLAGTRSAPVNGAIWARQLNLGTDALTKQIPVSACEALGIPGTTDSGLVCPVSNLTGDIPPPLNEPCQSGLDCQINHHCAEPETSAACARSKCLPGSALGSSCDPCVEMICAETPSCCASGWTQSCVDKVATVCDASCDTPECYVANLCAPSLAPVASTCDSCVATICAVDPSCCTTAWTQSCADRVFTDCGSGVPTAPTSGLSVCDYAAYAGGTGTITGNNTSQRAQVLGGRIGAAATGVLNLSHSNINGNVYSAGSLTTVNTAVAGSLNYAAGPNSIGASTTYTSLNNVAAPKVIRPTRTFTCGGTNVSAGTTLAPGSYGSVSIPNGQTLTLSAGTYYFSSFNIGAGGATAANRGTLALPVTGRITINVCGAVTFNNYARISGLTASTAANLDVYATGNIRMTPGSTTYGIFNSNTDVRVEGVSGGVPGASLYGIAWSGSSINVIGQDALVDATGLSASCKANVDSSFSATRRLDRLCSYAAYGKSGVAVSSTTQLRGGDVGSGGTFVATDTSQVSGNVLSIGAIAKGTTSLYGQSMRSRSTITGTATVYGTQTASASAAQVPIPSWPAVSFACTGGKPPGGVDQVLSANTTLAPGTYGNVSFNTGSRTLTLQSGDYYVGDLNLSQSTLTLALPAAGPQVRIFACGQVTLSNGLIMTNIAGGMDVSRFQVSSLSTAGVDASPAIYLNSGSNRPLFGTFLAPAGKISIGSNTTVHGTIWADRVYTFSSSILSADGFVGAACDAASIDASPTCPVNVTANPPNESATCDQNGLGYQDASCSGYDLAADIPCGGTVPVCNHGTSTFSGDLTLGYFAEAKGQMSLIYPSKAADGLCSASGVSIAPGNCVDVACTTPAGTYTVMIDPEEDLNECGAGSYNRRLDNWTVADGRSCASGGAPTEVEYEYVAQCEDDMSPKWGYLTWETTTPGASQIAFSTKVGQSSTELDSLGYTAVGLAELTPINTSSCSFFGPTAAGCPIALSDALGLGDNQGSHLALKIELLSVGSNLPILESWKMTYSCVYDE